MKNYPLLVQKLNSEKVPYKSHNLNQDKLLNIAIRGLPLNPKTDVGKLELDSLGFDVKSVVQMTTGPKATQKPIPLFYIQLVKTTNFNNVYKTV